MDVDEKYQEYFGGWYPRVSVKGECCIFICFRDGLFSFLI